MKPPLESLAPYNSHNSAPEMLRYILDHIAALIPTDYACLVSRIDDKRAFSLLTETGTPPPPNDKLNIIDLLQHHLQNINPASEPLWISDEALAKTPYRAALLFPLSMPDEVLGIIGIFSAELSQYTLDHMMKINVSIGIARMILENQHMYSVMAQNMITTQTIQLAAKEIANNPAPQHIIDILRDYFFDAHVTSSAILLFGPIRQDRPDEPYEYLEIKGTWSRRRGSEVAVGLRLYLNELQDLIELINEEQLLVFPNAGKLRRRLDPLLRAFMQAEQIRSVTLLGLTAANRMLGVILIGTERRHDFTPQELHSYRTVGKFLAVNIMTQMLQAQHDEVVQGRVALLEAVTDGVIMVLPSNKGARVLTANRRFGEIFGLSEENFQGWLLKDLLDKMRFSETQREELTKQWLAIPVRDPEIQRGEFRMINEEGHPLDIEWYSAPVYVEKQVLGRIYIFHDITPERSAQRLRSAFLSRISHELRTPLTSISGFAQFILESSGDSLPDSARGYTQIILDSAKHLNHVFTDMIEITRADAGEIKLHRKTAHLPDIIIDAVARMEMQYKARGQKVIMELDDDLPSVSIDINRMLQILQNLITNAIKYSPENSTIHITTAHVKRQQELGVDAPTDVILPAILVSVIDEGDGLTHEQAERAFMPFYRTDSAKKGGAEGVGLGLAVTRSLVEIHRGKIWAIPNKRGVKGGRFLFTIPTIEA